MAPLAREDLEGYARVLARQLAMTDVKARRNRAARHFFTQNGFAQTGLVKRFYAGRIDAIIMDKRLNPGRKGRPAT